MNSFVNAIGTQEARTANGMKALKSSANAVVDLFYNIGASRGKNIVPQFTAALVENRDLALRVAAWARDVRGGAGERQIYRDILVHLENTDPDAAVRLMNKTLELGRADDLLVFKTQPMKDVAYTLIGNALRSRNGLVAKWLPREKSSDAKTAFEIMKFFGMSPKQYRKALVSLSDTTEQKMCANDWDNINFSHVPSVAHARLKKAFGRHTPKYAEYVTALVKGTDPAVKINANAIFPHDVLKGRIGLHTHAWNKQELDVIEAQWAALPNYIGDAKVLPLVDVSGSMTCTAGKTGTTSCLEIAVALGLYFADKNTGEFKDCMLTFSSSPQLVKLTGNINQKIDQMVATDWAMSTNLNAAFAKILKTATDQKVAAADMPDTLVILSDMQFNGCVNHDDSALEMIRRKYEEAGYKVPTVVFWNLNASGNTPVSYDTSGVALVSGFSPAIATAVLKADIKNISPESIMMEAIMRPRYDV